MSFKEASRVSLADLLKVSSQRNPSEIVETYSVSENLGLVPQATLFNKKVALEDRTRYRVVRPGEIAYNPFLLWAGAAGANLTDKDVAVSPAYVVLAPPSREEALYWHYFFRSVSFGQRVSGLARGTVTRRRVASLQDILAMPLDIPEEGYRKRAARLLELLDNRADRLRTTNIALESIAQTMFKSWFVDFDPVRVKAEGREPEGMDAATAALLPERLEASEIGPIPEGWQVKPLDSIAKYLNGLALQKYPPESEIEFLPVIKIAQLRSGHTAGADTASMNLKPDYVVEDGDVLFSWSGTLLVEMWCGGRGALNQHLFKVTSSEVPKWFYFLATRHHLPHFREVAATKATTMGHIQRRHLAEAFIAVPSSRVLEEASKVFTPLLETWLNNAQQARLLQELRDTLLPRLISGKIRLPEAEREIEAATA